MHILVIYKPRFAYLEELWVPALCCSWESISPALPECASRRCTFSELSSEGGSCAWGSSSAAARPRPTSSAPRSWRTGPSSSCAGDNWHWKSRKSTVQQTAIVSHCLELVFCKFCNEKKWFLRTCLPARSTPRRWGPTCQVWWRAGRTSPPRWRRTCAGTTGALCPLRKSQSWLCPPAKK